MRLGVGDAFVTGASASVFKRDGLTFRYEARPNDRSYRDDGELFAIEGLEQTAANVIRNMKLLGIVP